ncbi:GNAT family N-acetyltransferase [Arthrobacter sp. FW305-BF8]|uniref:GNAT family N-acetyltransferase n=1 Tax=Arthrobacter sp. FW305-BF8 TaxID=2879617 RepID=UPI001F00ED9F|nr:GNAT family N-acetyltransferase [Arthrobacter sp. FW305-BF8]UKA52713.1 GNAT family N-acetyltransferase [Arthrobacter sp. FW305-BF8]
MTDHPQETAGGITTAAAEWAAVEELFGVRGEPSRCWCRFFALPGGSFAATPPAGRKAQLKDRFDGGGPAPGVLAYRGGSAVGWCAVEPRGCYPRILRSQVFKAAGAAANDDGGGSVWSVSCFVVAPGHRRSGVAAALLSAAVGHARATGAAVVEGYPVDPRERPKAGPSDLYQGTLGLFLAAGFEVVSDAVPGRRVVRLQVG